LNHTFSRENHKLTPSQLHGDAKAAAEQKGIKSTTVSISHSDAQVIAVAISSQ
jgi:phosphopantetheinyl transferase (holo-ACP synthase)